MESSVDPATVGTDGVLTPPLSHDSSLTELIEAELRTRLSQEQEQTVVPERPAPPVADQPESILVVDGGGGESPVLATDLLGQGEVSEVPAGAAETHTAAEVTSDSEVTGMAHRAEEKRGSVSGEYAEESVEEVLVQSELTGSEVAEDQLDQPEVVSTEVTHATAVAKADDAGEPSSPANSEAVAVDEAGRVVEGQLESPVDQGVSLPITEHEAVLESGLETDSFARSTSINASNSELTEGGVPVENIEVDTEVTSDISRAELTVTSTSGDDAAEVSPVQDTSEPAAEPMAPIQNTLEPAAEPVAPIQDTPEPPTEPVEPAQDTPEPPAEPATPVQDNTASPDAVSVPAAAAPAPCDAAPAKETEITAAEPTSKVTDDDSDEGVEDGKPPRSADAKKLRRKRKSDVDTEAGRTGGGRSALDSEGDSDISSEGSSGASSLTRSQDSGAAASGARLSESSEPDHDDELANVNLSQLRSSYLTNFDSTKPSPRTSNKLDTGVSIKNLKNTYTGPPVPAPRGCATGTELRPRDMSHITVNMASLRSVYSLPDRSQAAPTAKADVPAGVSLPSMRAAYVQQAQAQASPVPATPEKGVQTGVSIDKLRSSFSKDDHPADTTRIHVRSFDSSKAMKKFNSEPSEAAGADCRSCGRRVYQMERISAEKAVWHKNCFRCCECAKQVTVDTYASDEGRLYCAAHHRQLMKERAAHHAEDTAARSPAKEKQPVVQGDTMPESTTEEAEVVRASNKADYGLDDLQNLNVKDRFSVFERANYEDHEREPANVEVKRSQSILNKMKKFQERREGGGSSGDESNSEASGDEQRRDPDVVRSQRKYKKERPMSFSGLGDMKSRFEGGARREQASPAAETKGELAQLRGMICGGSLRASYERAVQESESPRPSSRQSPDDGPARGRAADMTSRFESGAASLTPGAEEPPSAPAPAPAQNGAAEENHTEESEPPRATTPESEPAPDTELLHSDTTKRMLSKFKQMEQTGKQDEELNVSREVAHGNAREVLSKFRQIQENALKEDLPDGPPPPKSFTPPPEEPAATAESEDAGDDDDAHDDPDIIKASQKVPDDFLNKRTDQARSLRDKFESWEPRPDRGDVAFAVEEDCKPSLEIARNMRAKFESLGSSSSRPTPEKTSHKSSRFIMEPSAAAEYCGTCNKRVYAMERLEVDKRILHKNCFRCTKCNCVLRMDTYTFNAGKLFCTPHFKQMFKTKGNYDEGFGIESRTKHWSSNGHSETSSVNGSATSAAVRPDAEADDVNGCPSPEPARANGHSASPAPEEEAAAPAPAEPADADVFQQVYESAVAEAM